MPAPPSAARAWIPALAGAFVLLVVAVVYATARGQGHWPPGHPWSGLTKTLLGVTLLLGAYRSSRAPGGVPQMPLIIVAGCAAASAAIWAASSALSGS